MLVSQIIASVLMFPCFRLLPAHASLKSISVMTHRPGFDHAISADYSALRDMVIKVRKGELMLGDGTKVLHDEQA